MPLPEKLPEPEPETLPLLMPLPAMPLPDMLPIPSLPDPPIRPQYPEEEESGWPGHHFEYEIACSSGVLHDPCDLSTPIHVCTPAMLHKRSCCVWLEGYAKFPPRSTQRWRALAQFKAVE